jgi:hypothetical protein
MNSAGEEDEEQVDYGEDSGGENGMSFNGQARSTTWRRMLCSRCIPADLLPGFGLTVNIEILPVTNVAGTGTIAVGPERSTSPMTLPLSCVRFHWTVQSLPTPSHWTMSLFSHPGTPTRKRNSLACR